MAAGSVELHAQLNSIRWIRNPVSSVIDNLTDRHYATVNTSPAAAAASQGLL